MHHGVARAQWIAQCESAHPPDLLQRLRGVGQSAESTGHPGDHATGGLGRPDGGRPDALGDRLTGRLGLDALLDHRGSHDRAALRGRVEQAHRQLHHPHPIGDGVVTAQDHRAAAAVSLDPDRLPQWTIAVQHLGAMRTHQLLQGARVVGLLQRDQCDVVVEVEVLVKLPPPRAVVVLDRQTAEHRVAVEQPFLDHGTHLGEVQRLGRPDHRVDHHQVVGTVHLQPESVLNAQTAPRFHAPILRSSAR